MHSSLQTDATTVDFLHFSKKYFLKSCVSCIYVVTNIKIWDSAYFKAFADNLKVPQKTISVSHTKENIVGKEESAGYQHFLLFPKCFEHLSLSMSTKVVIVLYKIKLTLYLW